MVADRTRVAPEGDSPLAERVCVPVDIEFGIVTFTEKLPEDVDVA
jgi:hypothetical protein